MLIVINYIHLYNIGLFYLDTRVLVPAKMRTNKNNYNQIYYNGDMLVL